MRLLSGGGNGVPHGCPYARSFPCGTREDASGGGETESAASRATEEDSPCVGRCRRAVRLTTYPDGRAGCRPGDGTDGPIAGFRSQGRCPLHKFKERFDVFSDAVFAIILTIMVLEVPVEIVHGQFDYRQFAINIGIYVVSFCYVADCWYKHALMFNEVDEVSHGAIILDFVLLLCVSLIPAFTHMMISDVTSVTVGMCGVSYLLVTVLEAVIAKSIIPSKGGSSDDARRTYGYIFGNSLFIGMGLIVLFTALSYFYPVPGFVLLIIIPIQSFISNAGRQQEVAEVSQLGRDGLDTFMDLSEADKRRFMGYMRSYGRVAHRSGVSQEERERAVRALSVNLQKTFGLSDRQVEEWSKRIDGGQYRHGQEDRRTRPREDG